ncbi:sulfatase-like hydrolase/transferase, partial [bacterium]|nr:sulfatase-like hydrolase/transferase [bacterium]
MKNIARAFVLFIFLASLLFQGPIITISPIKAESESVLPENIEAMLEEETVATDTRPNIVLIMTDDQRWDTIGNDGLNKVINQRYGRFVMPNVEERIVSSGVLFTNAFISTPESAAARASLLSGGFLPRDTGVLMNEWPNGGAKRFLDTSTMPVDLQESGYKTALIGRYMNEYNYLGTYIPPGWSTFVGIKDFTAWNNYSVIKGTSNSRPGQGSEEIFSEYITGWQETEAIRFVEENSDSPFFLFLSAPAPHLPAIPASVDKELYPGYKYRGRGVNEENINDKPGIMRAQVNDKVDIDRRDELQRDQLRSLNALDRSIGAIMDRLEVLGELDNTVFIFTSDNGYLWGEHKLYGKGLAYDESVRVPFVVAMPGIEAGADNRLIVADIDTAAAILELAGLANPASGQSFVSLLNNKEALGREEVIIERYGNETGFALIRTSDYKYVEYINGEKEFYDFNIDPTEKRNNYSNAAYKDIISDLKARLALKKGPVITTQTIPSGSIGQEYRASLASWGAGAEPGWALYDGALPPGLTLNEISGVISGRPTAGGHYNIAIKLSGNEPADHFGGLEFYIKKYRLVIEPSGTARLTYGPLVAAVTDNSAKIWFRVEPGAEVIIKYSIDPDFEEPFTTNTVLTEAESDFTGTIALSGLFENMTYYYRLFVDGEDMTPAAGLTFKTFPKKADSAKLVFLADFAVSPDKPAPSLNAVARKNPDMVVLLGDIDHGNPQNLNEMRAMHRANRGDEKLSGQALQDNILGSFPVAYVWDDHDYGGNNSDKNFSGRKQAIKAYDEYWPSYDRPREEDGIWHKFSYGDLVEVFMLDLRSQRDPATYLDPTFVPDNENRSNRDKLRYDTCRSLLDGNACPSGLPAGQKEWFKDSLFNSSARWKIVVTSVTWNPTTEKDEAWWDYKAEQLELMAYIRTQGISGVVFVSGDIHTGGAIDNGDNA